MNSHEMGSHMLMMKSPFFRAPNSVSQREIPGQTIIIQVRAWQSTAVNSVQKDTCAGTVNGHQCSQTKLEASSGGCWHQQHWPTQGYSSTGGKATCNIPRQPEAADPNFVQPGLVGLSWDRECSSNTDLQNGRSLSSFSEVVLKGCGCSQHSILHLYSQKCRNSGRIFSPKRILELENIFDIHSPTSVTVLIKTHDTSLLFLTPPPRETKSSRS